MRFILTNSREAYIPVKDELNAIVHYLDIEKLRFDDKFDYKIHIDRTIDQEFTEIPPMIIQPYIENAIIHGLVNSDKKGLISISIKQTEKSIICIIEDNGIGREKAEMIKNNIGIKRKSRGMIITKERLEILTKQHKEKFNVKVTDLKDNNGEPSGTRVEITMHYIES
jgi:LytS/YehU family sensor histidine kinase